MVHKGAPTPQATESLDQLYDQLTIARKDVHSHVLDLAIAYGKNASVFRQGSWRDTGVSFYLF